LRNRLGKFLMETASKRDTRLAHEEFFGGGPVEDDQMPLIDWMMHDWVPPRLGRTIMQEYLRERGAGLAPRERELVESWSLSFVGLYEVREVKVGSGLEVKDLVTGDVFFVHDVSLSKKLVRWDGLLARVVPGERGHEFTGAGIGVPRQQLEPLRAWMEQDRLRTGMPWPAYLKRNLPRIRRQPERLHAEWVESLQLSNTEGAELAFECNSKQRHKRGKGMLTELAGPALKHLRDEFTTQREMKRRTLNDPRPAEPVRDEIPPEVRHKLIMEHMEKHTAKWPDTALPALDGQTPRQAVKTPSGRPKVAALLRDFENQEEHKRQTGEPFYEVARLRAELGVKE
jgi:hypothetical protein